MKVVEEELLDNRMEESGIFLIWAGRPIMMNSVLEGLRQSRLDDNENECNERIAETSQRQHNPRHGDQLILRRLCNKPFVFDCDGIAIINVSRFRIILLAPVC